MARGLSVMQQGCGSRLLLAEDDPVVNKHLTHALRKAGFTVDSVSDGEEALRALEVGGFDLLVTDIIMPRLGGIELTQRLRQRRPEMPVVLISGYNEEMNVMQLIEPERVSYLQKPFASSRLIAAISALLSGGAGSAEPATG
jgi:DNA-binding response OmpR family regulator